jgi:hypothetical protein
MFLVSAFAKNWSLPDDDVFRWCDPGCGASNLHFAPVFKCPPLQRFARCDVNICLKSGLMLDEVELAALRPCGLQPDYLQGSPS